MKLNAFYEIAIVWSLLIFSTSLPSITKENFILHEKVQRNTTCFYESASRRTIYLFLNVYTLGKAADNAHPPLQVLQPFALTYLKLKKTR